MLHFIHQLSNHRAVNELFSNWTWSIREPQDFKQAAILESWTGPQDNIFLTLALFTVVRVGTCRGDLNHFAGLINLVNEHANS